MATQQTAAPGAVSDRQLLDVAGIAARTGTTERFARRLIRERRVPTIKLGRYVRVRAEDLDAYIEANIRPADTFRAHR